jgi:flagellar export protein FliJ
LQRGLLEATARVRQLEAQLAQERAALAEANKETRIMEKLKDRQQSRYYYELSRQETAETDELSTQQYLYRQAVGS